jgi:hypothetical protein
MYRGEDCGCGHHGRHHGDWQEREGEDYGCNRHGWHEGWGWHRHSSCGCCCYQCHRGMGFYRNFIPHEEIITKLEEYLKQLQAEAKGVEERIAELKTKGKPQ